MNRRQFLQLAALAAMGTATNSCARLSPRRVAPEPLARPEDYLLLTGCSIIDVARGIALKDHALLIRNRRIAAVLPPEAERPAAADRTLDLKGAWVMPGIINAHCHMSLSGAMGFGPGMIMAFERQLERNAEECVRHGVTTVRDMLSMGVFLEDLRHKIGRGDVLGPRIQWSSALDVRDGYTDRMLPFFKKTPFWQPVDTPEEGRLAVRRAADRGANFIKLFQQPRELLMPGSTIPVMDGTTVRAIQDEAERLGKYVAMHHTTLDGLMTGLDAGVPSLEHMATDKGIPEAAARRIIDNGHTIIPTASVAFALAYPRHGDVNWGKGFSVRIEQERRQSMPALIEEFCEPELAGSTLKYHRRLCDPASYESRHLFPWPDPTVMNAAANDGALNTIDLYRAGVTFGCGNDGGVPLIFPGAMVLEMRLLEEQGMRPADILRMATLNNARLIREEDNLGSVEPGKLADLVVFRDNPLETVQNAARPEMVFMGGRLVYRREKG
ncbi:MAG: amidohydrolase family protein [Thermodesulfobacteriota bacterium]